MEELNVELKKDQIKSIVLSSICVVLGILFCVIPLKMLDALEIVVCFVVLAYGVINVLGYCLMNSETKNYAMLIKGFVAIMIGIVLMFFVAIIVICLGLVVVLSGVLYIRSALLDKKDGDKKWWIGLVMGIVLVLLGATVSIIYNTPVAKNIVMIIFGITIIVDGILRMVYGFVVRKELHAFIIKQEVAAHKSEDVVEEKSVQQKTQKLEKNNEKIEENIENTEETAENVIEDEEKTELDDDEPEGFV